MNYSVKIASILISALLLHSCNLLSAAGLSSQGQPIKSSKGFVTASTTNSSVTIDHSQWDVLLKKHVNNEGLVNYKGFAKDQEALSAYLNLLSSQNPKDQWSVQELLAYYINLYNAYTVQLILDHYPTKSIKDIDGNWSKGFVSVGSKKLSLSAIENGILRKMDEPRIHFAINCASFSCPKLLNEAFTASKINEQLERVTKEFINSDKNDLDANNPKLSSIFDWYKKDFKINGEQDVIAYINQYASKKINEAAKITYKRYDWNLNEQE